MPPIILVHRIARQRRHQWNFNQARKRRDQKPRQGGHRREGGCQGARNQEGGQVGSG